MSATNGAVKKTMSKLMARERREQRKASTISAAARREAGFLGTVVRELLKIHRMDGHVNELAKTRIIWLASVCQATAESIVAVSAQSRPKKKRKVKVRRK